MVLILGACVQFRGLGGHVPAGHHPEEGLDLLGIDLKKLPGGVHPVGSEGSVEGVFDFQCLPAVDLPGDDAIEGEWNSGGVKVAHPSPDVVPVGHSDFHDSGHGRVS